MQTDGRAHLDLTKQRFGRLTALERVPRPENVKPSSRNAYWLCHCDCGREKIAAAHNLKAGNVQSCGCMSKGRKAKGGKAGAPDAKAHKTPVGPGNIYTSLETLATSCKCAACGKTFDRLSADWAYKRDGGDGHGRWFCSWRCMRADEKKTQPRRKPVIRTSTT